MSEKPVAVAQPFADNVAIFRAAPRDLTAPRRLNVVLPLVTMGHPSAVLDVGCGRGEFLGRLPSGVRRCGIDGLPAAEVAAGIEYRRQDIALGLPWPDGEFDAVFAGEVIEHLLDTATFLAECRRVLRPPGVLVLTTPNLAYWRNLLQWARHQQFFFVDHRAGENGHVRYFAPRTLAALLTESGFVVEDLFSVGDLPTSTSVLLRAAGRLIHRCCRLRNLSLIAKARRGPGGPDSAAANPPSPLGRPAKGVGECR